MRFENSMRLYTVTIMKEMQNVLRARSKVQSPGGS